MIARTTFLRLWALRDSLQFKLLASSLALTLSFLWGLMYFVPAYLLEKQESLHISQQLSVSRVQAAEIDQKLRDRLAVLQTVGSRVEVSRLDENLYAQNYLKERYVLHPMFVAGIILYRQDGTAVGDYPVLPGRQGTNYADREYFQKVMGTGQPFISQPFMAKVLKKPIVAISVPLFDAAGSVLGVLTGSIPLDEEFLGQFSDPNLMGDTESLLLSKRGRLIIASTDASRVMTPIPQTALADQLLGSDEAGFVAKSVQGIEKVYASKRVPSSDWVLVTALPTEIAFQSVKDLRTILIQVALLMTLLAVSLAVFQSRRLMRSLKQTSNQLDEMSRGLQPLRRLKETGDSELRSLISNFNRLSDSVISQQTQLQTEHHRLALAEQNQTQINQELTKYKLLLEAAMASMRDAVFILNPEGQFIHLNKAFASFHRFKSVAECSKVLSDYPDIVEAFRLTGEVLPVEEWPVMRSLRGESAEQFEFRVRRKDTGESWIGSYNYAPILDSDGHIIGGAITARDVTEQRKIEADLEQYRNHLEEQVAIRTSELVAANEELDSFAYAVSHDLRAPLRAMSGFSHILVKTYGATLDAQGKNYLDQISIASEKMGLLIDGILALSRASRGTFKPELLDIASMATQQLEELARVDPARTVDWHVEPGLMAIGDKVTVEALLGNLLGNAWKYTGKTEGATIRVHAGKHGIANEICVSDNGAGFDMAHAEQLFQPFRRLHRHDEFPGIGIGLATVQRIVHRHGGRIRAESTPHGGATFCFTLSKQLPEKAHES